MNAPIPTGPLRPLQPGETGEENLYDDNTSSWSGQLVPLFRREINGIPVAVANAPDKAVSGTPDNQMVPR